MSSPILDLSYRNYDGPLEPPIYRWWAIARTGMRLATKKSGFWVWACLSAWWYLALIFIFYFTTSLNVGNANPANPMSQLASQVNWPNMFVHAFSYGQLLLFILALLIGVGSIANDNRANALIVYLSKPCSKLDYVIGKWLAIFLPITAVVGAPMLLFYGYCLMSYRDYGFTADPWLLGKLLLIIPVPGIIHASLGLGISSLFKQGRLAGAAYAGLYFFGVFFTKAMQVAHFANISQTGTQRIVDNLSYASVDGLQIGFAKASLNTNGGIALPFFGGQMARADGLFIG
ncbi:MAG TPA: ABC transporter permease subunit, partial [Fimbriimonadaceae bacterium]|nr:ABC transporter permease subunit [Fimbriimonadaceae bacterium]